MRKIKQINSVGALNFLDFFELVVFLVSMLFLHSFIHVDLEFLVPFFFEVLGEIGICLCSIMLFFILLIIPRYGDVFK